jgi:hypothetical protein
MASSTPPDAGSPDPAPSPRQQAVTVVVRELERHAAVTGGWDGPVRLFALIRTAEAVRRDEGLADRLPVDVLEAALADPEHLTAIEQEDLPEAPGLGDLLAGIAWPDTVDGAAIVLESSVVPSEVEAALPPDEDEAARVLADHPAKQELRMAAAVLRDGTGSCAVRSRANDHDALVSVGPELVPALLQVLQATLDD